MAMTLFLASRRQNDWIVTEVRGILDSESVPELRDGVISMIGEKAHPLHVIADLSELSYCDVDGLSALAAIRTLLHDGGGELRLVCPEGRVLRILRISGLAHALPVHPTLDAAVRSAGKAG
ncbi:STAS domain-containing protein [Streptomyces sp. HC44]|uniref:Anti-sigma factor antagonist n=1 Tax=Streptomyces scabichelini TaxID=2711217 RepID=A0A6G4V6N6_9ACTN|nr:STAS domain-containing protein [Streptomyces scabichelini]NGO09517.1 STAS domain-containing protein [Streptomyces scabichelini]